MRRANAVAMGKGKSAARPQDSNVNRKPNQLFLALFAISGVCGLIYEVVWTRLFTVIIGNTVFSVSAILTVFMAGLALGSRIAGRLLDQKPIPLVRAYAVLEAGIGIYNLLLPLFLKAADPLFGSVYSAGYQSVVILGLARLLISFVLLIVPATLMGATLPVLIRFYVDDIENAGRAAGRVYAVNTCGAAVGAAVAGFVLVPYAGVIFALRFAAILNLGIAVATWLAGRQHDTFSIRVADSGVPGPRVILIAMFISGLSALMDEVAWTRVLSLVVGPTTYAFTLMLCAMIAGLGLGAAIGSRWTNRSAFAWVQVGIGITSLALVPAFGQLPLWIARLVTRYVSSFAAIQTLEFLILFTLMLLPTLLFGMTFPIASKLYATSDSLLGTEVSAIYAFNTVGGIAGSLLAGFFLIPHIGSQSTLILAALLNVLVGAGVGPLTVSRPRRRNAAIAVALAVPLVALIPRWNPELMSSGAYKYAPVYAANSDLETMLTSGDLLYFKEGATTTVSVRKFGGHVSLAIDGKVDASDGGDMTTQKMLAHLPLLLGRQSKDVAIIGLGSGVTAAAALTHPIEKLDVVEISPEVVEASRFFSHVNHSALSDSRTELIVGDGRNHLRYAKRQYDVIISEPSNPWMSGMASLFTREFFSEARSHLTPGGIHCQWFHSYNMSLDDMRTVIATFRTVFPHATLWTLTEYDFLLLGSASPLTIDETAFQNNFDRVSGDLREIKIQDRYSVLSLLQLRDEELDRFASSAVLNTDDRPILEFRAPRSIYANTTGQNLAALLAVPRKTVLENATAENHLHKGEMFLAAEAFNDAMKEFQAAIALDTRNAHLLLAAAALYSQQGNYARAIELLDKALGEDPKNIDALEKMADALSNQGSARLAEIVERLIGLAPENPAGLHYLASIRLYEGRVDEAIQIAKHLLERDPKSTRTRNLLAVAYDKTFQPNLAEAEFRHAIEQSPDDWLSYNNYGLFLIGRDRTAEARDQFRRAIRLNPENVQAFVGMGEAFRQAGKTREAETWYRKALRLDPNQPVARQFVLEPR